MKTSFAYILLPVAALFIIGCANDAGVEPHSAPDGSVPLQFSTAVISPMTGSATRAATDIHEGAFAAGETFYAYFPENIRVGETESAAHTIYTTTSTNTPTAATQPYFVAGESSATVHAYYPATVTNVSTSFSVLLDQTTDANYKASDLMYATATVSKTSASVATPLTFTHKMSKIIVSVTAGTGISVIKKVRIVGGYNTIALSGLDCTLGALSNAIGTADNACVKLYEDNTGAASVSCAALIPPQTISGGFLQIVTNEGTATFSLTDKTFASGYSYTYTLQMTLAAINVNTDITDWDNAGNSLIIDEGGTTLNERNETLPEGAAAVDLGLPSGTLWANMNIGATSETDYGTYFAWGETTGYTEGAESNPKTDFSWATYRWTEDGGTTFTRYVPESRTSYWGGEGEPDNYLLLHSLDDAATNNWGGYWRMPTQEEMKELITETDNTWVDDYNETGIPGYKFTNKADDSKFIFLPAAGFRGGTSIHDRGASAYYWSSTVISNISYYSWRLYFVSSSADTNGSNRYYGFTIRAVKSN